MAFPPVDWRFRHMVNENGLQAVKALSLRALNLILANDEVNGFRRRLSDAHPAAGQPSFQGASDGQYDSPGQHHSSFAEAEPW